MLLLPSQPLLSADALLERKKKEVQRHVDREEFRKELTRCTCTIHHLISVHISSAFLPVNTGTLPVLCCKVITSTFTQDPDLEKNITLSIFPSFQSHYHFLCWIFAISIQTCYNFSYHLDTLVTLHLLVATALPCSPQP